MCTWPEYLERAAAARAERQMQRQRREVDAVDGARYALAGASSLVAFGSNDYLALSHHPALRQALAEAAWRWGTGSGASHLLGGHTRAHAELETRLAQWQAAYIPQVRALYFGTGYLANLALMTALGPAEATLVADKRIHASLVDGARLAAGVLRIYPHADYAAAERLLARAQTPLRLLVTDSVFSMDGDLADLPRLLALAERFDALLVVDDAHGFGLLGAQGRGALEHFALRSPRLVYMATLGKAAGVAGAVVCARAQIIDHLVNTGRAYIYTTASPPALAQALQTSLDLIEGDYGQQARVRLRALAQQLQQALQPVAARAGWTLPVRKGAIHPLIVGDNATALRLAAGLEARGLWLPAVRPPTVAAGTARLRISLSAAHHPADVQRLAEALADLVACGDAFSSAPRP